jgi:hypothetical protein
MSKFRVKKGLGKVTGALEALVEPVEAYQNTNTVREPDEYVIQVPEDRCNPEGSYVLRLRANKTQFIVMGKRPRTNFANSSLTDFPVSRTDERRLLANTSGDTSVNI